MQLQFNNPPLGGRGRDQALERRDNIFSFLAVVFCVLGSSLPRDGRKDWKKRGGLFSMLCFPSPHIHTLVRWDAAEAVTDWMPLTEWTLSQAVLSAQAAGCVYCCILPAKSRHQHRKGRRQQQQQHQGPTSSSNPPQMLSGLLNRNNGIASGVPTACTPRKIATVVTHD